MDGYIAHCLYIGEIVPKSIDSIIDFIDQFYGNQKVSAFFLAHSIRHTERQQNYKGKKHKHNPS